MNRLPYTPCAQWVEQLAATHPDDLSPFERDALDTHVASCPACTAVRAENHAIDMLMLDLADVEPLPDLPMLPSQFPGTMSLPALADRSMSEINHYRCGKPTNGQYSLEIFRRAMLEHDDAAWTLLVEHFKEILLDAFRRHPRSEAASRLDDPENYVAKAFERFWMAVVRNQHVTFTSLGRALRFLRLCLNSAILDILRAHARRNEVPLPEPGSAGEPAVEDQDDGNERWEIIRTMLPSERERRLAFLLYYCNLRPREIVHRCPQEFPDVHEIFRMTRNIVGRLKRSAGLIRWRLDGNRSEAPTNEFGRSHDTLPASRRLRHHRSGGTVTSSREGSF
jgi:DNA-directed RNA polymerase specialized sigma24 family protein